MGYMRIAMKFLLFILFLSNRVFVDSAFFSSDSPSRTKRTIISAVPQSPLSTTEAEDRRKESQKQNDPLLSLNLNLDAMAQSADAPVAQELLQRIRALHQEGYYESAPDVVSSNTVLKAWKEGNNPEKAYEYLQEMLEDDAKVDGKFSFKI
jgi:pentatricopeptide repeat protein